MSARRRAGASRRAVARWCALLVVALAAGRCGDSTTPDGDGGARLTAVRPKDPPPPAPTGAADEVVATPPQADTPRDPHAPRSRQVVSDADPYAFSVEPAEIDLGVLRPDEDARCAFEIVNLDARPLRLVNIDGSCDCVAFEYERGDLAPGGRRRVSTTIRAENRGNKLLSAFVQANDRTVTTRTVAIRYSIEPELRFDPPRADFGQRVVGSSARLELRILYQLPTGVAPLALAPVLGQELPIRWRLGDPTATDLPGAITQVSQPLELELDAAVPVRSFRSELRFEAPGHRKAKLPLTGAVHGGIWLDPEELHLGVGEVGKPRRGTARLRFAKDAPSIGAVTTSHPELTAQWSPEEGSRSLRLQLVLTAAAAGEFEGEVKIAVASLPEPLLLKVRAKVR